MQDICQALIEARRDATEQQVLMPSGSRAAFLTCIYVFPLHFIAITYMLSQIFDILEKLGLADGSSRVRFHEYVPPPKPILALSARFGCLCRSQRTLQSGLRGVSRERYGCADSWI